jgi:hypothetical protein
MVTNILTAIAIYLYLVVAWFIIACAWGFYLLSTWLLKSRQNMRMSDNGP